MSEKILYLDCSSGISGDMFAAALLDLGADEKVLLDALDSLPLDGYKVEIKDISKSGIRAKDFAVVLDEAHENHDHDMDYLYGSQSGEGQKAQETKHHAHDSRNLSDVSKIIRAGNFDEEAKDLALSMFEILAEAEAEAHGRPVEEIHFHEVGAVDSIVDIVAAAVCFTNLHVSRVAFSPLYEGCGQIRCQHGLIPVPVPAVTAIASKYNLPLHLTGIEEELITPTGAAIAAAIRTDKALPNTFVIKKTGLGAGKREYEAPGILRAMIFEEVSSFEEEDAVLVLETNVDDCSGEALSYAMSQLMDAGALDAFAIPVYMKKNRPAYLIEVIAESKDQKVLESVLFKNTTTIGIRRAYMQRTKLNRKVVTMETPWGNAKIKCCDFEGETRFYPENDSVTSLCEKNGIGFPEMYGLLSSYAREHQSL